MMGRFGFPFFRRRPQATTPLAMTPVSAATDLWQIGDRAECIYFGPWESHGFLHRYGPAKGEILFVDRLAAGPRTPDWKGGLCLGFARWPCQYFSALAFRKLPPPMADEQIAASRSFADACSGRTRFSSTEGSPR